MKEKNIFVLGDLVIDHTVFVVKPTNPVQPAGGEEVFEAIRRENNAGGAANSARILSLLSSGTTYLWGILGQSRWGSFKDILEYSHSLDGATHNIELRGVMDESGTTMNTITRLVELKNGRYVRKVRYDDTGHMHVTDGKRYSVLYNLERVNSKTPLDAIVINDLDQGAITQELVAKVSTFATLEDIPLFVDPKRQRDKYEHIRGTAILPNLEEWCYLVEKESQADRFRRGLNNEAILREIAQLSFRYLGNFKYYIITCDKKGSVLIVPAPDSKNDYCIYRAEAVYKKDPVVDGLLGAGDILTAVFALHFDKDLAKKDDRDTAKMVIDAFQAAHEAAGAYCGKPWHRMPSQEDIKTLNKKQNTAGMSKKTSIGGALRFLPRNAEIDLKPHKTAIPEIYSCNKKLQDELERLVSDFKNPTRSHFMIGAPSGFGKSIIIKNMRHILPNAKIENTTGGDLLDIATGDLKKAAQKLKGESPAMTHSFLVVDEAYRRELFDSKKRGKHFLDLLNRLLDENVRLVLIDSLFYKLGDKPISMMSDIRNRCMLYMFDSIIDRPLDIPLLIAGAIVHSEQIKKTPIKISVEFLLAAVSQILKDKNPRHALSSILEACVKVSKRVDAVFELSDYPSRFENDNILNALTEKHYVISY